MNTKNFASRRYYFGRKSGWQGVTSDQPGLADTAEMRLEPRFPELRIKLLDHAVRDAPPVWIEHHVVGDIVEDQSLRSISFRRRFDLVASDEGVISGAHHLDGRAHLVREDPFERQAVEGAEHRLVLQQTMVADDVFP